MSNNFTPVRHPCEDVPSYNYPSIDDQIEGSYYTRSDWNLLLADETTGESKGDSKDEVGQIIVIKYALIAINFYINL